MKADFTMTLVDASEGMLAASRTINPDCEHLQGDMRSVRLGRVFDAVFIHDAIMYLTSEDDLSRAIETAFIHTKPGGVALFVPDFVRETFTPSTDHGGHDGEGRALRYLEWSFDPDPADSTFVSHFVYMLKEGDAVTVERDVHTCGLFARHVWLRLLQGREFQTRIVVDGYNRDLFIALRPANPLVRFVGVPVDGPRNEDLIRVAFCVIVVRDSDLALQLLRQIDPCAHDLDIRLPDARIFRLARTLLGPARRRPVGSDLLFWIRQMLCHV
jgi:hypothetical protein